MADNCNPIRYHCSTILEDRQRRIARPPVNTAINNETAGDVAFENDGAAIVSVDGYIQEQMVRLRDLDRQSLEGNATIEYEPWRGSRHMSALETSLREPVVGTVTLSEETGRVSVFSDGNIRTNQRHELGGKWRAE